MFPVKLNVKACPHGLVKKEAIGICVFEAGFKTELGVIAVDVGAVQGKLIVNVWLVWPQTFDPVTVTLWTLLSCRFGPEITPVLELIVEPAGNPVAEKTRGPPPPLLLKNPETSNE